MHRLRLRALSLPGLRHEELTAARRAYRGRRSGRRFTIPVMYAEREGTLTIFVGHPERKRWWRNLRVGAEVEVRLRGRRLRGQADVVEDSAAVETYLDRYPRARTVIEAADSPTFVRVAALTPIG